MKTNLIKYDEYKIQLIRQFEHFYNFKPLQLEHFQHMDDFKPLDKHLYHNIKKSFESKKDEPTNIKQLEQLYIFMIKHITGKDIIIGKQKMKDSLREYNYKVDNHFLKYHIPLNSYTRKQSF